MPKVKLSAAEITSAGWYLIVVLSAIGGQGKTFFAELITLILQAAGYEVQVFSADVQRRLIAKLEAVVTLDTDLIDVAAADPLALLRAFSPLSQGIARSVENGGSIVLDTAATWDVPTLKYIRDMRLDEVVTQSGGQLLITLVTSSNLDAMRAMTASTEIVRAALPLARTLWVLNERVGPVFPPDFDARLLGLEPQQLANMRAGVTEVVLPRMDDRLWQPVDRAPGLNLLKVVTADPSVLAQLWVDHAGNPLDRLSAAVVQRRVAAWIAGMMEAASQAVGFSRAER
jgi:hypothetical protein